jgi:hypothetical protein
MTMMVQPQWYFRQDMTLHFELTRTKIEIEIVNHGPSMLLNATEIPVIWEPRFFRINFAPHVAHRYT